MPKIIVDISEHAYNNVKELAPINLGRCNYKGIIMYAVNAIKNGTLLTESNAVDCNNCKNNLHRGNGTSYCATGDGICHYEYEETTKNDLGVDYISKQEVVGLIMHIWGKNHSGDDAMQECIDAIRVMPSVTPQLSSGLEKNSKKLEKDFGELDCISRQAAITFVCKNTKEILKDTMSLKVKLSDDYLYENVAKIMRNPKVLPSVTPQEPRKGHWIGNYQVDFGEWQEYDVKLSDGYVTDNCHCSECGEELLSGDRGMFCPYCGSDNREVEE